MKLKGLLAALLFTITTSASAGFLIDPYFGVGSSATTFDADALEDEDSTDSYNSFGSRLGYSFLLFSAGVDYEMATVDGDSRTNTSVFVGVDMPILIRAWAEYMISSSLEDDDLADDIDVDFKDGYSIGLGFTGLPFVSINVELQYINYELSVSGSSLDGVDVAAANTLVSVSLPLDF